MIGKRKKVIVIGLDGATFDIINPLVKKGMLPNIRKFMEEGAYGNLRSTIHPTTPHAWTSFMTGKNAGKHGIFDFTELKSGTYDLRLVNGSYRQGESIWSILSKLQRKVIVINVPFTYPAEEVNGVLISGLDAPGVDGNFAYPKNIYEEIVKNVGRYDLRGTFPIGKTKKWYKLERLEGVIRNNVDVAKYLMKTREWDFMMIVLGSTDHVQHMFWRYMEEKEKGIKGEETDRYGDIIHYTYKLVDEAIGAILTEAGEDVTAILMSDHGGGSIKSIIYLNKWLEEEGLLSFKELQNERTKLTLYNALFYGIKKIRFLMKRLLPPRVKGLLKLFFPGIKDKAESFLYFSKINWSKTKAYAYGMYGNININLKGREPLGTVTPGKEYEDILKLITSRLMALKDPSDDSRVVDKVYRKNDLFHGSRVDKAPDLLVAWKDYIYFSRATMDNKEDTVFGSLFNIDSSDFEYSGTHRLNGIFLCKGEDIKKRLCLNNIKILDIAPTILHLMGVPVPDDMDGRVFAEMFTEERMKGRPVIYSKTQSAGEGADKGEHNYTDKDEAEIKNRLHGLGYME